MRLYYNFGLRFLFLLMVIPLILCCQQSRSESGKTHKVIISVIAGQSSSDAGIETLITEAINNNFSNIELDWEIMGWGEKFESQMHAKFAAGEVPDIMIGKAQDVATYYPSGYLQKLPDDIVNYITLKGLDSVKVNGQYYGVPYNAFYQGVFYNKTIFKELGLKIPKTNEQLQNAILILRTHHIIGMCQQRCRLI